MAGLVLRKAQALFASRRCYGSGKDECGRAIVLADRVYVYDNSVDDVEAQLCTRTRAGRLRKIYCDLPQWVADSVEGLPRDPDFVDLRAA